jgi:ribose 5-phosphate isomerase
MSIEREKQVAAEAAAELVENGMTVGLVGRGRSADRIDFTPGG